jgi:hypothetical protein
MLPNSHLRPALPASLLAIILSAATALGQIATGNIEGKVIDPSGAAVAGATVTATSPSLQLPQVIATTDTSGNYQLRDLSAPRSVSRLVWSLGFPDLYS